MGGEKVFVPVDNLRKLHLIYSDTCSTCGICADYCPTYLATKDPELIPGKKHEFALKLINAQKSFLRMIFGPKPVDVKELREKVNHLYTCTLCGRCSEVCSYNVDLHSLWANLRVSIFKAGFTPEPLKALRDTLKNAKDPYGAGLDMRTFWVRRARLRSVPVKDKANVVFFVGCVTALRAQNRTVAASIAQILSFLGEDWTLLGDKEWCCGSPIMMVGDEETAKEFAEHNVEVIEEKHADIVVVGCASCYRMLRWEYPTLLRRRPRFEVLHIVEFLDRYLEEGKLKPVKSDVPVTYHDPCELSRLGGVVKEPRRILKALTNNFVELPEHGVDTRCCGGGGLLQALNNELRVRIAMERIRQVEKVGAKIVTSACPACKLALLDGVNSLGSSVEVLDIVELLARQLQLQPK